jgi:adenosylcobinamide-GDP ribazoletransferase
MERERRRDKALTGLFIAFGFLTVAPVPARAWHDPGGFGRSFSWFPVVGFALGCALAAVALGVSAVLPPQVSAALIVTLGVALTGGLHLDGLMDSCDGLFCVRLPEERLEIMKDSRVGAFGVLGAVCLLLGKYAAISSLMEGKRGLLVAGLLLAPVLGRWAMTAATVLFPYGRAEETLGSTFHRAAGPRQLAVASASTLAVTAVIGVWQGFFPAAAALAVGCTLAYGFIRFALSRLPGLTGDVYGAVGEITESAVLVVFAGWG